jgi:DNA polymerase-1
MTLIQTREEFDEHISNIRNARLLALDTETNIAPRWNRYLVGFSYYCVDDSGQPKMGYFPFRHNHNRQLFVNHDNIPYEWLKELGTVLTEHTAGKTFIFHNAKFDIPVFESEGIELSGVMYWDTMLMSHFVDENVFSHGLKQLAMSFWGKEAGSESEFLKKLLKNLNGRWETCPPAVMAEYCCKDSQLTYNLYQKFLVEMQEQDLIKLWDEALLFNKALMDIEATGIRINPQVALTLHLQSQKELEESRTYLGFDPMKPSELAHRLYASPSDGGLGFRPQEYSKRKSKEFPQGLPTMNELILSRLDHEVVRKVLRHRQVVKADSTWYEGFLSKMSPQERLHTEYKQHGTVTGRLSSSNPNLQQLPRDKEKTPVKSILSASDGYELWEFDYSQIELRLGALYADDPGFLSAYREGADVHDLTAKSVGAYDSPGISRDQARYVGKTTNFLIIYQGGPQVLRTTLWKDGRLDVPLTTCETIINNFHKNSPGFRDVANRATLTASSNGFVKLWSGRRRHFKFQSESHKAFNSIIQGGAAEIVKSSLIQLWRNRYRLVGQVHDSVWIELPKSEVEESVPKIQEIMSKWVEEKFELPFPVDAKLLATDGVTTSDPVLV